MGRFFCRQPLSDRYGEFAAAVFAPVIIEYVAGDQVIPGIGRFLPAEIEGVGRRRDAADQHG